MNKNEFKVVYEKYDLFFHLTSLVFTIKNVNQYKSFRAITVLLCNF